MILTPVTDHSQVVREFVLSLNRRDNKLFDFVINTSRNDSGTYVSLLPTRHVSCPEVEVNRSGKEEYINCIDSVDGPNSKLKNGTSEHACAEVTMSFTTEPSQTLTAERPLTTDQTRVSIVSTGIISGMVVVFVLAVYNSSVKVGSRVRKMLRRKSLSIKVRFTRGNGQGQELEDGADDEPMYVSPESMQIASGPNNQTNTQICLDQSQNNQVHGFIANCTAIMDGGNADKDNSGLFTRPNSHPKHNHAHPPSNLVCSGELVRTSNFGRPLSFDVLEQRDECQNGDSSTYIHYEDTSCDGISPYNHYYPMNASGRTQRTSSLVDNDLYCCGDSYAQRKRDGQTNF